MRGYENMTEAEIAARNARIGQIVDAVHSVTTPAQVTKPSKYRNVKQEALGIVFDSKREAAQYLLLHAREQAGEITNLRLQVQFPLCCPTENPHEPNPVVAFYVADFVYEQDGVTHVVDAKGVKTKEFRLKAKWLELQNGITIELV